MTQNADNVLDHFDLFRGPEYQQMLANKKQMFENPRDPAEVERVNERLAALQSSLETKFERWEKLEAKQNGG